LKLETKNEKNITMTKKQRYEAILSYFRKEMPEADTELEFGSIFQLLVAVVLSAQCTDKRINQVTPELFRQYPDAKAMAQAEVDEVLEYIKSVSYPNSKAEHLVKLARMLVERHNGEVPEDMNQLLDLPGVGRKTANVIQSVAFGKSTMAVDTHVFRVSHRLGLVSAKADNPLKVERELVKNIPVEDIPRAHHWLLLHGRYVCTSRRPHCERCGLNDACPSASHYHAANRSASLSSSGDGSGSQPA
jgi:endonuclease-3